MQYRFLLYLILFSSFSASSQTKALLCGKVKSSDNFIISVYQPINGYYNSAFIDTTRLNGAIVNGTDSVHQYISLDKPAFVTVKFKNEKKQLIGAVDVLLFPGDSVNLHCDLDTKDATWVKFAGSNADGQKIFNDINHVHYEKFQPFFDVLNELPANEKSFTGQIKALVKSDMDKFSKAQNLSPDFLHAMDDCFKILFYQQVLNKFTGGFRQSDVISKGERDSIIEKLLADAPKNPDDIKGLYNSNLYLNSYFNYLSYKKYKLDNILPLYTEREYRTGEHEYDIDKDLAPMTYVEDKAVREDLWALNILTYISMGVVDYGSSVIDQYCTIFPGNHWEKLLREELYNRSNQSKITYKLQSPIRYIDSTKKIDRLNTLLKELPDGKPVFVDCWATWCAPCVSAFTYNTQLDSLLNANNIEKLYISIDNPNGRISWKKSIDKYALGGYHILANNELITDIKRVCDIPNPEHSPIEIPRYLLINKKGIVVLNNADGPNKLGELKAQIQQKLLSK